jgi:RNA polymerase sigma factor (sigma-70 family)
MLLLVTYGESRVFDLRVRNIALVATKEQFDELLKWFDSDRDRAAQRYEEIRRNLIRVFLNRGCTDSEDLADDTINRVTLKMPGLRESYVGSPERYFHGVAKNVIREHIRKRGQINQLPPESSSRQDLEPFFQCLDECLAKLPRKNSRLILLYYEGERRKKIDLHKKLSSIMGIKQTAMRARVHRVRSKLRDCVLECISRKIGSNDTLLADI